MMSFWIDQRANRHRFSGRIMRSLQHSTSAIDTASEAENRATGDAPYHRASRQNP